MVDCSVSTYQSNHEFEDRHFIVPTMKFDDKGARKGTLLGVMDGHGGWQAAEFTKVNLPTIATQELGKASSRGSEEDHAKAVEPRVLAYRAVVAAAADWPSNCCVLRAFCADW